MFQTVGHHAIDMYAEAMEMPLYRRTIEGSSVAQEKDYRETPEDEVEDLYALLKQVKVGANLGYCIYENFVDYRANTKTCLLVSSM